MEPLITDRPSSDSADHIREDFDLVDILSVLWKSRLLFAIPLILCPILTLAGLAASPKLYDSSAVIRVGSLQPLDRKEPVETTKELVSRLLVENNLHRKHAAKTNPRIVEVRPIDITPFVEIVAVGTDPERTRAFVQQAADKVAAEQTARQQALIALRQGHLDSITEQVRELRQQTKQIDALLQDKALSTERKVALAVERGTLESASVLSVARLQDLELAIHEMVNNPAAVHVSASLSDSPSSPRTAPVMALSVLLGLILSLTIVLTREFWRRSAHRF
jgi:LPS O-antigen subunit length determinant protein (WzzB/FepE family)